MNRSTDTTETVLKYIHTQVAVQANNLGPDSLLFADGYLDSTAMLELILWIGDTFSVTIQNEDLVPENFATVRNIVEFIERRAGAQNQAEDTPAAIPAGID